MKAILFFREVGCWLGLVLFCPVVAWAQGTSPWTDAVGVLGIPMDGPKIWRGHATLSAPLKMMGVERRWFLLSATVALALWNAINSLLIGGVIFGVLYTTGLLAWRKDPAMLSILKVSASFRARYDPGKWSSSPWVVRIRE